MVCALALAAGCGDDEQPEIETTEASDIGGFYATTFHTLSKGGCDDPENEQQPPFFELAQVGSGDSTSYTLGVCPSDDNATCQSTGANVFDEPDGEAWTGSDYLALEEANRCRFVYLERSADMDGDIVHVELRKFEELVDIDQAPCTPEETEVRASELPCSTLEVLEGQRGS